MSLLPGPIVTALLVSAATASATATASAYKVDYQIHSNNDLHEWPQLLKKGARRFKVDPHYVSSQQCEAMEIESLDGCFLLNHDKPIVQFNDNYSSTDDLLELLSVITSSPEFAAVGKLTVSLCFKEAPDYCLEDSDKFQSWLRLVDDLYVRATETLSSEQVEFVLDGDGKPKDCLVGKWAEWNSVWINTGGPQDAFYSNSIENDYYRFQVLNDPENIANWTWMAQNNYGKFSESSYPYQLWEPDAQDDILAYIDIYRSGLEHSPGYHFAINIDIAMFEVYARDATGRAINQPIEDTDNASSPLISPFPDSQESFCNFVAFTTTLPGENHVVSYSVQCAEGSVGEYPSDIFEMKRAVLPEDATNWLLGDVESFLVSADVAQSPVHDGVTSVMFLASSGHTVIMNIDESYDPSNIIQRYLPKLDNEIYFDALFGPCDDFTWVEAVLGFGGSSWGHLSGMCSLVLSSINNSTLSLKLFEFTSNSIDAVAMTERSFPAPVISAEEILTSAQIVVSPESSVSSGLLAVLCASGGIVYGTELTAEIDTPATRWVALSVGGHISAGVADGVLMLMTDFGFCYNSHSKNTRSYPSVCAATPVPTDTVLDYSIGLIREWKKIFHASSCTAAEDSLPTCTEISSCHPDILHGSYDQGISPSLALNSRKAANGNIEYFFLAVHKGLSSSVVSTLSAQSKWAHDSQSDATSAVVGAERENGCGTPSVNNGLVADSFEISDWIQTLHMFS